MKKRTVDGFTTFDEYHRERLKDPEYVRALKEVEHEYILIKSLIDARLKRNLSQAQLARKMGTKQPVISRLERGSVKPSVALLERIAKALDATLEIKLLPR